MTAPAARSRSATNESRGALAPTRASEPAVVSMRSAVAMLSLISTGMPCSGPRGPLALRSASSASAIATASGLTSMTERSVGPAVDRLDAREVRLGQRAGGVRAGAHRRLELGDRRLLELERRGPGGRRLGGVAYRGRHGPPRGDGQAARHPGVQQLPPAHPAAAASALLLGLRHGDTSWTAQCNPEGMRAILHAPPEPSGRCYTPARNIAARTSHDRCDTEANAEHRGPTSGRGDRSLP